jgi:hypothetical protein
MTDDGWNVIAIWVLMAIALGATWLAAALYSRKHTR